MYSREQLSAGLRAIGLAPGDVAMVHASVRAVGEVAGGPDEIHLAIKDVLTPDGTLIMYASCPRFIDEIGRGNLSPAQEAELLEKLPPFNAETARASRENGALVELLRTYSGSRVNQHPARFVVWGAQSDCLLSEQPWDYAFGRGSLLERFVELHGKILLLGSDHDNVTFLHYAEHVVDIPDKRISRFKVPVAENGVRVWRDMEEVDTSEGAHASWPPAFFAEIVDGYLAATGNRGGRVGDAWSHLLSARGLLDHALPVMRAVAGGNSPSGSRPQPGTSDGPLSRYNDVPSLATPRSSVRDVMEGYAIRILGRDDVALLDRVADDVFDEPVNADWAREFLGDPRHHLVVATDGETIVGFASAVHYVHPDKPPELWINEVGVAPTHHRRGIGRRMLAALFARGRSLGCSQAWVLTEEENEAARGLYAAMGGIEDKSVMYTFRLQG